MHNVQPQWNLSPEILQDITIAQGQGRVTGNGTLAINTGKFTGRSPQDRFLVRDDISKNKIWWGKVNKAISANNFDRLYDEMTAYLNGKEVFVHDGYVCE